MTEYQNINPEKPVGGTQYRDAVAHLSKVLLEGLRHGHFEVTLKSSISKGGKRELLVEAGNSHKFVIPEDEIPV